MKTLTALKKNTDKLPIPRGVQDVLPISVLYDDGIFKAGQAYTKTYSFSDINYAVASEEEQEDMCHKYNTVLSMFETGITTKITVEKRRLNRRDFEKTALMPYKSDGYDQYRREKNDDILTKISGENGYVLHKYITLQCSEKNVDDARSYFARVSADITRGLKTLGSACRELDANERLRIIHDFYHVGENAYYDIDVKQLRRKGHSFKDYICPDSMEFKPDYFKFGDRYGRVLFMREYGSYVPDNIISQLSAINNNFALSIDIGPVPSDEARREVERRLFGIETNKTNWQRKQNKNNNFSAAIPYEMEQEEKDTKEFLYDLDHRDQRMTLSIITIVHTAATKKELDDDTKTIRAAARGCHCQLGILRFQQMDGLNTVLPFGPCSICNFRTLTTENLDAFMPFYVQDVFDTQGIYYGQNVKNRNLIVIDREKLMNGNAVILGASGGGKSFFAKDEITSIYLTKDQVDILIIDPEREYTKLVEALGGEVINISATSSTHINALDMTREYGLDENGKDYVDPIILKSEFVMSLCEQAMGKEYLSAQHASIVDRCTRTVYNDYIRRGFKGQAPTLKYFRSELLKQKEPEARDLALALEKFTEGSLNTFAKPTNVNTKNRLICYDILELGKQLMPIGMLVVLDSIFNRITQNRQKGRKTYIYIDEIYLLFQNEYSAVFLSALWKRVRKYGAFATGITQNVSDLLNSELANKMLMNSEFVILFNQKASDREQLSQILSISASQMDYITDTEPGRGLMKIGGALIPFLNQFPKNTELYKLMTTKPSET